MAKKQAERTPTTGTLEALVSDAFSELTGLGEELREWHDNLPDGLKDHRGDIDEAASTLEGLTEPSDVPAAVKELPVTYLPLRARKASRADRGGQATYELGVVVEVLDKWLEEHKAKVDDKRMDEGEQDRFQNDQFQAMGERITALLDAGAHRVVVLDDRGGSDSFLLMGLDEHGEKYDPNAAKAASAGELEEAVEAYRDEVQAVIDEADGVTYPGMYA